MLSLLLTIPFLIFIYHYIRNGFLLPSFVGTLGSRLIWAAAFVAAYLLTTLKGATTPVAAGLFVLQFLAQMLIPHGFAMNMGKNGEPWSAMPPIKVLTLFGKDVTVPKYWPAWFFPQYTQEEWSALPMWKRTLLDFGGMAVVGAIRGAVVFLPCIALGLSPLAALLGVAITAAWQPISYLVGHHIPFGILDNTPNSAEWGEFLIGAGWAISLLVFR